MSTRTVKHAKRVARLAAPEVGAAVERGDISLHAAIEITNNVPREEQTTEVAAVADRTRERRTSNGVPARSVLPVSKALPRRDPDVLRQRALESIHGAATVLDQYADAPIRSNAQVAYWRDLIDGSMRTLRLLRKRLEVEHASA